MSHRVQEQPLTNCRAVTRASTLAKAKEEQRLEVARHGRAVEGDKLPLVNPAAPHATRQQQQQQREQRLLKRHRRHNPPQGVQPEAPPAAPPEDMPGLLALLPDGVLDQVMSSLLAAEEGSSCIRSTCRWLRSAFDRCNTRLVLRGTTQQLPDGFPARLLDLVRNSPRVSSLALAEGLECVTWPQVLEAGGPPLLLRLESLTLAHRPLALDLEALAACTALQHLVLHVDEPDEQTALLRRLQAACGGTLRHLEILNCSSVRDFGPLAACATLQHLTLSSCPHLDDLTPMAACVGLQQLRLGGSRQLRDLLPLTACVQLQALHITACPKLTDLGPLAALDALRDLNLRGCTRISDISALASCVALQRLDLRGCELVRDLGPLAACIDLRKLALATGVIHGLSDLAPLVPCVALEHMSVGCTAYRSKQRGESLWDCLASMVGPGRRE